MRTAIYVDGFNLYYRALKGTPYKWLDLKQLCENLLQPHNKIVSIKYFTALVTGKIDPRQPIRQKTYIRALEKHIPELSVHYGQFTSHAIKLPRSPLTTPVRYVEVLRTEEKKSDVNIAVHLLNDAWLDNYDCAILISNDSDLAEPLRLAREQGKMIGLICPALKGYPSRELAKYAHFIKQVRKRVLPLSQLPTTITGTTITKPSSW